MPKMAADALEKTGAMFSNPNSARSSRPNRPNRIVRVRFAKGLRYGRIAANAAQAAVCPNPHRAVNPLADGEGLVVGQSFLNSKRFYRHPMNLQQSLFSAGPNVSFVIFRHANDADRSVHREEW